MLQSEDLPVVKEGHLYIKTGKLWQRRLLKLTSGCLRVYKSGSAAELNDLLATVVLHQSSVTPTIGTKNAVTISQQNGVSQQFNLQLEKRNRVTYLYAC
jgi:hypothetical protein